MGRLDDIVARNKHANARVGGGFIGAAIHAAQDPTASPEEKKNRVLAAMIVGGLVVAIAILVAVFA